MDIETQNMLRIAALALQFCSESETLPVFTKWAVKGHKEYNPDCVNPDCLFQSTDLEWGKELSSSTSYMLHIANM